MGQLKAIVTATGVDTFFGRAAQLVQGAGDEVREYIKAQTPPSMLVHTHKHVLVLENYFYTFFGHRQ